VHVALMLSQAIYWLNPERQTDKLKDAQCYNAAGRKDA
jgi:hypothetical protein